MLGTLGSDKSYLLLCRLKMARNSPRKYAFGTDEYFVKKVEDIIHLNNVKEYPSSPTKLVDHLYIGGYSDAENVAYLRRLGITHILNCAAFRTLGGSPYPPETGIMGYLEFRADDDESYDMLQHFPRAKAFIDDARVRGGNVLVHCAMGINRSGLICAAYILVDKHMKLLDVMRLLKTRRKLILSNPGFRLQLVRFARQKGLLE